MTIRIGDLKPGHPEMLRPTGTVQVIVKVRKADYVPAAVKLRARIDEYLFTADVLASELPQVEKDSQVVSVSNEKLRIIE